MLPNQIKDRQKKEAITTLPSNRNFLQPRSSQKIPLKIKNRTFEEQETLTSPNGCVQGCHRVFGCHIGDHSCTAFISGKIQIFCYNSYLFCVLELLLYIHTTLALALYQFSLIAICIKNLSFLFQRLIIFLLGIFIPLFVPILLMCSGFILQQ